MKHITIILAFLMTVGSQVSAGFIADRMAQKNDSCFNGCVITSEIPEHTNNEEEKSFFDQQNKMVNCSQPLPVFTLGLSSNPSSTEVTALCTCIWASFPVDGWERRTSEKLRNGEDSGWRGKALLSRFFSSLKECGGMKL